MRFWKDWDEREKTIALKIAGLCLAVFTVFILISTISYLFHWKEDMSLLANADAMDKATEVGNKAGKLGYRFGHLLVCRMFGLGSLALPILLGAASVRIIAGKWRYSLIKTALVTIFGAIVSSIALAYIGSLVGLGTAFGGGLGGDFGTFVSDSLTNLLGAVVTGAVVVVILLAYTLLSSTRCSEAFAALFKSKEEEGCDEEPEEVETVNENVTSKRPSIFKWKKETAPEEGNDAEAESAVTEPAVTMDGPAVEAESKVSGKVPEVQAAQTVTDAGEQAEGSFEIIQGEGLDTTIREPLKPIDNRLDPPDGLPKYKFPPLTLLKDYAGARKDVSREELTKNNNKIRAALANYKIQVDDVKAIVGPTVTLYKVYLAPGIQIAQVKRLQEDIAMSLNAKGVRVVALSDSVGIEVANDTASIVPLKALLNDNAFRESKAELPVAIGYTITQEVKVFDLSDAPHLLIAGATKQGKSVGLNVIVSSLIYCKHPSELKFVFIDPKMVEFSSYSQLVKHYLAVLPDAEDEESEAENAIVKNPKKAEKILRSLCQEMDDRYMLLSKAGVNKITLYNEKYKDRKLSPDKGHRYLPYLVCIVDEYADLTMSIGGSPETRAASKSIQSSIIRLAQKGRAAGLHVIIATQRPSVDVISGIIKSNFPMRIAFRTASRVDSTTILDAPGAEKLIGRGDMLFSAGIESERIQCGLVGGDEIDAITEFIGNQTGYGKSYNTPYYLPEPADTGADGGNGGGTTDMSDVDERFTEAAELVVTTQKASTSYLQTRLGMGFAKAARVMSQLEAAGVVGPQEGAKPRQVLVPDLNSLQPILDSFVK